MLAFVIGFDCSTVGAGALVTKKQLYKVNKVNLYDLESGDRLDLSLYETIKLKDKIIGTEELEAIEKEYQNDDIWNNVYISSDFKRFVVLLDNEKADFYGFYANLKITVDGSDNYLGNGIIGGSAFEYGETPSFLVVAYDIKNDIIDICFNHYSIFTKKHRNYHYLYKGSYRLINYLTKFHGYRDTEHYWLLNGCLEYKETANSLESLIVPNGCWYVKIPYNLKNSNIKNIVFNKSVRVIDFENSYTGVVDSVTFYLSKKTSIKVIKRLILSCINIYKARSIDYSNDLARERLSLILELHKNLKERNKECRLNSDKEYLISEAYRIGIKIELY